MTREYQGVTKFIDRHGKVRWRARAKGRPTTMIPGLYGSTEFIKAWEAWREGKPREIGLSRSVPGTISAMIAAFYMWPKFTGDDEIADTTRAQYRAALERFREKNGDKAIAGSLTPQRITDKLDSMAIEPSNMLLRALRWLCRFGVAKDMLKSDPTIGIKKRRPRRESDGHHTWTDAEVAKFMAYNFRTPELTAKARLALNLLLCTASRKSDAVVLGRQHEIDDGASLKFRQVKTNKEMVLPVLAPLRKAIDGSKREGLTFLLTEYGLPFTANGFGNWFRDRCDEAGLPHCTSHGLRKCAATNLAMARKSEHEIQAVTGLSLSMVRVYTKKVEQRLLAAEAAEAILGPKAERGRGKPSTRFAKNSAKSLKSNGVKS